MSEDDLQPTMPFVTVTSVGGPHDDESYGAGFEMGQLEAILAQAHSSVHLIDILIHAVNKPQADLLAMKHGFVIDLTEDSGDGWMQLLIRRDIGEVDDDGTEGA